MRQGRDDARRNHTGTFSTQPRISPGCCPGVQPAAPAEPHGFEPRSRTPSSLRDTLHATERCARMRQIDPRAAASVEAVVSGVPGRTLARDDAHERRRARAHTPASARGKRASARPRRVLARLVRSERPQRLGGDDRMQRQARVRFDEIAERIATDAVSDEAGPDCADDRTACPAEAIARPGPCVVRETCPNATCHSIATAALGGGRATLAGSDSEGNQRARPSTERPLPA